ncbi:MAG TPA: hypothetical protein PLC61_04375 [Chitinophagales bacterium]|nr:hypothetical protein [Chitinophagales bacterium]
MAKKYKYLTKIQDLRLIPSRVLKFKKSKWTKLKSILTKKIQAVSVERRQNILKTTPRFPLGFRANLNLLEFFNETQPNALTLKYKSKSKLKIFDKFKVSVTKGRFSYLSSLSKDKIQSHLKLKYLLNQNKRVTRQKCKDRDLYIKNIYNDKFAIRGLTSSFYFFNSALEIKDRIKSGVLLLNGKRLSTYNNFKRGDVLKITSEALDLKKNIKSVFSNYSIPSHLEADIYSQTIVVVKDLSMTSQDDYHLISLEYINAQKI